MINNYNALHEIIKQGELNGKKLLVTKNIFDNDIIL